MTRLARVLVVSLSLVASGGVVGAVASGVVGFLVAVAMQGPNDRFDLMLGAYVGAMWGATLGAVLFPLAGWLLMRRVALGRALLGTAVGTIAGGVVGWFVQFANDGFVRVLVASVVGFLLAVLVLRRSAVASDAAALPPSESVS